MVKYQVVVQMMLNPEDQEQLSDHYHYFRTNLNNYMLEFFQVKVEVEVVVKGLVSVLVLSLSFSQLYRT